MNEAEFVGRGHEMRQLRRWVTDAAEGRGSFVLLAGEPGIGKTSMGAAIAQFAAGAGCLVAWGRCRETQGAPPYWPWVQLLRALSTATGRDLTGLLPPATSEPAAEMETDRFRLFDSISRGLTGVAAETPLLLILDDLHRADDASIGLLRFVVTSISDQPIVILGTVRDAEVTSTHSLGHLIGEVAGIGVLNLVQLSGLSRGETEELVRRKGVQLEGPAIRLLQDRTGGNPFFLSELLNLGAPDKAVPLSVGAAIRAHLATLPSPTRELLFVAAVLGRDIRADWLAAVTGRPAADVLATLAPALDAGLVLPRADTSGGIHFRHALIQQALYASLDAEHRLELHDRVATALPAIVGDDALFAIDLAQHALEAVSRPGGRERAFDLARRAARSAQGQLAYETAAEWFSRALDLMSPGDDERMRLTLELGRAAGRAGHVAQARGAYEQAWKEASRSGATAVLADAALGLGDVVVSAGTVDAGLVRMLERTLGRIGDDNPGLTIRLTARLATELYWGGGLDRARRLAGEAVDMARQVGDRRALAAALAAQQFVLRGPDDLALRLAVGEELVGLAGALDDEALELQARRLLVPDRLQEDPIAADRELEALEVLAAHTGLPLANWYALIYRTIRATMMGDVDVAAALIAEAEALGQRLEAQPAPIYAAGQRFVVLRQGNRIDEAEDEVRRSAARWPVLVTFRCLLALLLADVGRREEVGAILDGLVDDGCAAVPRDSLWLASVCLLAEAAAEVESADHAAVLHDLLRPYTGRIAVQGVVNWWGAVDYYLGRTATVLGHLDEAEAAFRSALRLHEAWGAAPFVGSTLRGYAAMLRRRSSGDDDERAARLDARAADLRTARRAPIGSDFREPRKENADESAGPRRTGRVLTTVLFVDVVGSTALAARLGDAAWAALRSQFLALARGELDRHEGTEIDVAGDGLLGTFTGPARAIGCATAIRHRCQDIGLQIRAGVHTGEVERDDHGGVAGLAVHIGARIMAEAAPGEVLVSGTVKDLVVGAGLTFTERGTRHLRGVPGTWPVFVVAG